MILSEIQSCLSHPQVLGLLAQEFVSSGFDVTHIVKVITATDVYQLSGLQTHVSQKESSHFARATLRGLTPEQFFDSVAEAVWLLSALPQ